MSLYTQLYADTERACHFKYGGIYHRAAYSNYDLVSPPGNGSNKPQMAAVLEALQALGRNDRTRLSAVVAAYERFLQRPFHDAEPGSRIYGYTNTTRPWLIWMVARAAGYRELERAARLNVRSAAILMALGASWWRPDWAGSPSYAAGHLLTWTGARSGECRTINGRRFNDDGTPHPMLFLADQPLAPVLDALTGRSGQNVAEWGAFAALRERLGIDPQSILTRREKRALSAVLRARQPSRRLRRRLYRLVGWLNEGQRPRTSFTCSRRADGVFTIAAPGINQGSTRFVPFLAAWPTHRRPPCPYWDTPHYRWLGPSYGHLMPGDPRFREPEPQFALEILRGAGPLGPGAIAVRYEGGEPVFREDLLQNAGQDKAVPRPSGSTIWEVTFAPNGADLKS